MTKGRDIAAESLENLLGAARIQQRNGMLRVEYIRDKRLEEGEIYLSAGEPVYARAGHLVGSTALDYLLAWRNIRFAFVTDTPQPVANISPPRSRPGSVTTPLGLRGRGPSPTTDELKWPALAQGPAWNQPAPMSTDMAGIARLIPTKNGVTQDVFALGLTRRQRLVYFMIDGQRNVAEIAHTTNRTLQEAVSILNELRELSLIIW